jgi:hypothetical protein
VGSSFIVGYFFVRHKYSVAGAFSMAIAISSQIARILPRGESLSSASVLDAVFDVAAVLG